MAKVSAVSGHALDMTAFNFSNLYDGVHYVATSSLFAVTYASGFRDVFTGHGFDYNRNGEPTDGTVTSYAGYVGNEKYWEAKGIRIDAKDIADAAGTPTVADDGRVFENALSGKDVLKGGDDDDVLMGFGGNDTLTGGRGADTLWGGKGADTFFYRKAADSTAGDADYIADFSGPDRIHLKAIDADETHNGNQAFDFIGKQDFHKEAGELRLERAGGSTTIEADTDGDGLADLTIVLNGSKALDAGDFVL